MKMMKRLAVLCGVLVFIFVQLSLVGAVEESGDFDDWEIFGFEVEKLLNLGSGLLATGLFSVTMLAYKRTKRKKLLCVGIAFLLFAIKGFLTSSELFFGEEVGVWVDPTASVLNFAILVSFFLGLVKK